MLKDKRNEEKRFYELEEEMTPNKSFRKKERGRMWKRTAAIAASAMLFGTVAELPIRCHCKSFRFKYRTGF